MVEIAPTSIFSVYSECGYFFSCIGLSTSDKVETHFEVCVTLKLSFVILANLVIHSTQTDSSYPLITSTDAVS
jgi:hypothetical protein